MNRGVNGTGSSDIPKGYRMTELGRLPEEWEIVTVQSIAQVRGGYGFPHEYQGRTDGEYPFYKVSDMNLRGNETVMGAANNYVDDGTLGELRARAFPEDTVIFPKIGAAVHTNKKRILSRPSIIDNNVMGVTVTATDDCTPRFLLHVFETVDLGELSNPGPLPSITAQRVKAMPVALPALLEQKKIAAVLSAVRDAKENTEAVIEAAKELKKSLMKYLFTYGPVPVDEAENVPLRETEIGEIPEEWQMAQVREVCQVKTSTISLSAAQEADTGRDTDVLVHAIKVADMNAPRNSREIVSSEIEVRLPEREAAKRTVPPSSVIFPKRGAAIATNKKRLTTEWTALDPNLIAVIPGAEVDPDYLYTWSLTFDIASIQSPGPTPQLNKKDVEPVMLPTPALAVQRGVVGMVGALDEKIGAEEDRRRALEELFRTLLNGLMTAKIRVHDLEVEA